MRVPRRFRLTTLLVALSAAAFAAGGARIWYEVQIAPQRADEAALASPEFRGVAARWSGAPNEWLNLHRRVVHVWFDV